MRIHDISPAEGTNKSKYRVGRGIGTGNGKTSGKGHKGQKARSGASTRPGFEGGQMPLARRLPKRGFHNKFAKNYTSVNLRSLDIFDDGATIGLDELRERGVVRQITGPLKILAVGELTKKFNIKAAAYSEAARAKIEAAGGKAEVV